MLKLVRLVALCLLSVDPVGSVMAAETFIQLDVVAERDGSRQFESTVFIEAGKEGALSLLHESKEQGYQYRFSVGTPFVSPSGKTGAELRVSLFDQVGREWALRASPSAGIEIGKAAKLSGPIRDAKGVLGEYSIQVVAEIVTVEEIQQRVGYAPNAGKPCEGNQLAPYSPPPSDSSDKARIDESSESAKDRQCCMARCAAGSVWYGYYLQCCGVMWCCDCGVCCHPP